MLVKHNQDLTGLNTMGIQSTAKQFFCIESIEDLQELIQNNRIVQPLHILGGGSNVLLLNELINGTVIQNCIKGIHILSEDDSAVEVKVGAGENWNDFVQWCINHNYAGIENLTLIPGSVGASPMQNIGAYGVEVKDVITQVECVDLTTAELVTFSNKECEFDYRTSIFKTKFKGRYCITSVIFSLQKTPVFQVHYKALANKLAQRNITEDQLTLKLVSDTVREIRMSKLPDPAELHNCGSFFKNPIVSEEVLDRIRQTYPDVPSYPEPNGLHKVPAGWLIEQSGWRGYREGAVGVYEKQALIIVNYGGATGQGVYDLSEEILQSVMNKFGIELEREVNLIS